MTSETHHHLATAVASGRNTGPRLFSNRFTDATRRQPFDFRQPSLGILDIQLTGPHAGKVSINSGPVIDPVCFSDKFMVVATPSSVDVFSFLLPLLF